MEPMEQHITKTYKGDSWSHDIKQVLLLTLDVEHQSLLVRF